MKKTLIVVIFLISVVLSSCTKSTINKTIKSETITSENKEKEYQEKLSDTAFKQGFQVSALLSNSVSYTWWQYQNKAEGEEPIWKLGQYCDLSTTRTGYDSTKNDLTLSTLFSEGYGIESNEGSTEILKNKSGSKEIKVNLDTNTVSLNIDTSKEYIDNDGNIKKRVDGEDWVHMIIEQAAGGINVSEYDEIIIEIDFTITSNEIYDSTIGASQFQWVFSIKDKDSVIGDYFWFNLTFFDSRYSEFPGTELYDQGKADATGKFIYAPKTSSYLDEPIEINKKYSVKLDIKPYIVDAFNKAKEKGALAESNLESMILGSFNIGWEVSNVSKVGVDISHISLKVNK